jgi:hypothetical protein
MTKITRQNAVVHTTEELIALKTDVEKAGGRIAQIITLRNGGGLSCIVEFTDVGSS